MDALRFQHARDAHDVPQCRKEVSFTKRAGGEAPLEEVASHSLTEVHRSGVGLVCLSDPCSKAVDTFWNGDEMHII